MKHLLAFSSSLAASANYQQLAAAPDQLYTRQNNEFQMPVDAYVEWLASLGTGATAFRVFTASLRLRGNPQIMPFAPAAFDVDQPQYQDLGDFPIKLVAEENLRVEALHTGAGPDICRAFVSLKQRSAPSHNINFPQPRWVRATASNVDVAENWGALSALAFDDVLEGGSYAVYDMRVYEAALFAARLVFQDQHERPGVLAQADINALPQLRTTLGPRTMFGVFDTYSPPQVECFSSASATHTPVVWLLIAKADGFQPPFRGQIGY